MNALRVAGRLVLQNRWLWILLLCWPPLLALLLGTLEGHPTAEDALASLQMESLYGVVAAGFAGGMLLGQEQHSRRIGFVLARAVGRTEYLAALWLAVVGPIALYAADCSLAGAWFGLGGAALAHFWAAEVLVAGSTAAGAILGSVYLPGYLASALALGVCLGGPLLFPAQKGWALPVLAALFVGDPRPQGHSGSFGLGVAEAIALAAGLFAVAAWRFRQRDLALKQE